MPICGQGWPEFELFVELVADVGAVVWQWYRQRSPRNRRRNECGRRAPRVKSDRAKPLILIDAGHGGIDPGAASAGSFKEKTVVLAVAQALKAQLSARAAMTFR